MCQVLFKNSVQAKLGYLFNHALTWHAIPRNRGITCQCLRSRDATICRQCFPIGLFLRVAFSRRGLRSCPLCNQDIDIRYVIA
jgi:hypothetical protein